MRGGEAVEFQSDDDILSMLGPYFGLKTEGGKFFATTMMLPTLISSTDRGSILPVGYLVAPVGAAIRVPEFDWKGLEEAAQWD